VQALQEIQHASGIGIEGLEQGKQQQQTPHTIRIWTATGAITNAGADHSDIARPDSGLKGLGGGELAGIQPLPGHQLGPNHQGQGAVLAEAANKSRQALITTVTSQNLASQRFGIILAGPLQGDRLVGDPIQIELGQACFNRRSLSWVASEQQPRICFLKKVAAEGIQTLKILGVIHNHQRVYSPQLCQVCGIQALATSDHNPGLGLAALDLIKAIDQQAAFAFTRPANQANHLYGLICQGLVKP
jgi:hypothetical protein